MSNADQPNRRGNRTEHTLAGQLIRYTALAEWQPLFDRVDQEKPVAEMFHVTYLVESEQAARPLTFVVNGCPGAASAYLHMGALGPKRIAFGSKGHLPKPPVQIVDNLESWLSFTDLVLLIPLGQALAVAYRKMIQRQLTMLLAKKFQSRRLRKAVQVGQINRKKLSFGKSNET